MHVALAADQNMVPGLHVTLYSLLMSTEVEPHIHLVHEGLTVEQIELLRETISLGGDVKSFQTIPFRSLAVSSGEATFHGSLLTFSLIALPQYLNDVGRFIWLDSDLIVTCNLGALWKKEFDGAIAAVSHSKTKHVLPKWREMLNDAGIENGHPHFNTGVCILDIDEWTRKSVAERAFAAEKKYQIGVDQPLLNAVTNFARLPSRWNEPCYRSGRRPNLLGSSVWHMVGSPKPWDAGGQLHKSYSAFEHVRSHTAHQAQHTIDRFKRAGRLSRSYMTLLKERWRDWRSA